MKSLFKDSFIYGIGGLLSKLVGFVLLPIYTHLLLPEEYGILNLLYLVGSVLSLLFGLMISSGFIRNYYDKNDYNYHNKIFASAFWFILFTIVLFSYPIFSLSEEISRILFKFENGSFYLKLIYIVSAPKAISALFYGFLRASKQPKRFITINLIVFIITIVFTIFFVVYLKWGVKGVLFGQLIGAAIEIFIFLYILFSKSMLRFSIAAMKDMLSFSIPLIPIQVSSLILSITDRFLLQKYIGLEEVGLYSLGFKLASILPIFIITPLLAWGPYVYTLVNEPQKCKKTISDFTRYYLLFALFIALFISIFSKELILLLAPEQYFSSWKIVFLLAISQVFFGSQRVVSIGLNIVKKTWISGIFWISAACLNIGLNIILIPRFGMLAAAGVSTFSYLLVFVGFIIVLKWVYPIEFANEKMLAVTFWAVFIYYLSTLNYLDKILFIIIIKVILLSVFLVGIYLFRYLENDEIDDIKIYIGEKKEQYF